MVKPALCCLLLAPALLFAQENKVEYQVTQLSETVYMLKGSGGNIGVSAGSDGVYIIDDQVEPLTDQLLTALRGIADSPVRFVVNTHYHGDHVGGNEALGKAGAVIISHDNIYNRMSTDQLNNFFGETTPAYPREALPVVTFADGVTLRLNGEAAQVIHVPRGHTDGDSIVHFPGSNVIHVSDIWFNGLYPFIDLDAGGTIQGTIKAVDVALDLADGETKIIPGHGPLGDKAGLQAYREYLTKAMANVQALVDEGLSLEAAIAAEPTAEWDEELGNVWISPAQFVTFIYNSIKGIEHYPQAGAG